MIFDFVIEGPIACQFQANTGSAETTVRSTFFVIVVMEDRETPLDSAVGFFRPTATIGGAATAVTVR